MQRIDRISAPVPSPLQVLPVLPQTGGLQPNEEWH